MNFRIKIVDKDVFKEAVDNFQRFLNSDIKIRIEEGDAIFDFDESEQSRWHLFTLASFYGSQLFNKRKRLRLLERQTCNVVVPKPITNQPIEIRTDWNQKILFNPVFLLTAESSMIRRFIDMLSEYDRSFKKAYDMALAMQAIKDSVFNEEKENKLNYIHLKEHELAKANLEKENALQSVSLKEKDFQVATAVVISASLLIIMFVLFSRQRQKNKLNKQLIANNQKIEQQNQELNELNESKNRLLSIDPVRSDFFTEP